MATIIFTTEDRLNAAQNLKQIKVPRIYYLDGKEPKNIHEFIKGVVLKGTIQLSHQIIYE